MWQAAQEPVHGSPADSVVVESPLPAGVSTILRFVFNLPSWLQVTLALVGAITAAVVAWLAWRHRLAIRDWILSRSRGWKIGATVAAAITLMVAGGVGFAGFHYMEHDNDFCVSCHVMKPAFQRFQQSEHSKLECHDCHRQSMFASMMELYYWVAERPEKIPPHAPVPTRVCNECHMQQQAGDSTWKRILATGGHSIHMRRDEPKLEKVECVTCHGAEVHRFATVRQTCGQSECHDDMKLVLGRMADQSSEHCTTCHSFTARSGENVSPDSARVATIPQASDCLSCHAMREKLEDLDPRREPHGAVCGTCHNPHADTTVAASWKTCTSSGCHTRPDTLTPFHRGLGSHRLNDCGMCHKAHSWRVQGGQCQSCHRGLFQSHPQVTPPRPRADAGAPDSANVGRPRGGDAAATTAPEVPAAAALPDDWLPASGRRHGPNAEENEPPAPGPMPPPAVGQDTSRFPHDRHRNVPCLACHNPGDAHGRVTIREPEGCQACHHAPAQRAACAACHQAGSYTGRRTVATPVRMAVFPQPVERSLPFDHAQHARTECRTCHTAPRTLAVTRTCASCHDDHHRAEAACATCHAATRAGHPREAVHQGCGGSGCHADARAVALPATRGLCLTCHTAKSDHKPARECASCHAIDWHGATRGGSGR